jgi:hypothetical protein
MGGLDWKEKKISPGEGRSMREDLAWREEGFLGGRAIPAEGLVGGGIFWTCLHGWANLEPFFLYEDKKFRPLYYTIKIETKSQSTCPPSAM